MREYAVRVSREGRWWMVDVPQIGYRTQATSLGEVEGMARDLIAVAENLAKDWFDLNVQVDFASLGEAVDLLDRARDLEAKAREELDTAAKSRRLAAQALRAKHQLSVADIAAIFQVTPARVYQLLNKNKISD